MLFGAHCSGGIKKALNNAVGMNADVVQLFVQSPRTWRFPNHDPKDLERFRERREEAGIPALVQVLERCNDRTWLLMENSAGTGGTIGRSVDELAVIFEALNAHERLGLCLDS